MGAATAARLTVANFHSFCHRVLTESGPEVGLPARPDVLDGIGQFLLIRDIRPSLTLVYHNGEWFYGDLVRFINRAKDELVTPDDFDAFVAREREVFEDRYGSYANAAARLLIQGNLRPVREVRNVYAKIRGKERAEAMGQEVEYDLADVTKAADREARRTVHGSGKAASRNQFTPEQLTQIDELADTYVADGAALEVMRWSEIASVYRAYQEELTRRGALDFGEQIAAVTQLFKARPNILRRWQRQFRYLLVDEFQDANQDLYHADPDEIGVVMPERPPVYLLEENRRTTRAIHDWAQRWASDRPIQTDAGAMRVQARAAGPEGRPVQVLTYPEADADACRRAVASVLKELVGPAGDVKPRDIVVLTPRSPRSSWLGGGKVGSYTLISEAGPEGAPLPAPTSAWEVRLSTIHRFKGLESPVVILAEIDGRVPADQLGGPPLRGCHAGQDAPGRHRLRGSD